MYSIRLEKDEKMQNFIPETEEEVEELEEWLESLR